MAWRSTPRWQGRVMTHIKEVGPIGTNPAPTAAFDRFAWRLAPFTLSMSVAMVILLAGLYVTTQYDGLQLAARDVQELALKQVLGG